MVEKNSEGQRIYLVYDFEELCGVFSSLSAAKEAVAEHLSLVKEYTQHKSRRLGFGEVSFEVYHDSGERRWIYALLAKTKDNGGDLHRRKVVIYQYNLDEYYSSMKRLSQQKSDALLQADARKLINAAEPKSHQ